MVHAYTALPLMSTSDHRAVVLWASLALGRAAEPGPEDGEGSFGKSPCEIDPRWADARATARRREVVVGVLAYLALTWEGRGILVAMAVGALGGWALIASMVTA